MVLYKDLIQERYSEDKKRTVSLLKNKEVKRGLCASCNRAETCTLSHSVNESIWDCEDFDDTQVLKTELPGNEKLKTSNIPSEKNMPGLCAFCLNKNGCSLKSVEGGIWHCEEYA